MREDLKRSMKKITILYSNFFLKFLKITLSFTLGGGRKTQDPEMEMKLIEWYHDYHIEKNFPITARLIKKKALEFSLCKDFAASKGWLEKFKKKYNLEIVRETYLRKINH